ncbi:M1 family metallopeptidase [Massilia endophytica]|uniref:M1 family metallopeptidase n=1 Tax=Massilia endophytica TaxID=2899220 RepID=UPI001E34877B|nr:M1 family metallopeptidase [Massilia endophytica]UGQ47577.1 M1 family metallopeptidase [Massilia endophytica]
MRFRRLLNVLPAAALLTGLALQSTLFAQGALVVAVPTPTTDTGIPFAAADAAAVRTPSAPGAWGGERSGNEATLSDRVVDYKIEARLDPVKHTVEGRQQLTWRNRSQQPVNAVYLHLYLNAFQNGGSTFFTELRNRGGAPDVKDGEWGYIELRNVRQNGAAVNWSFVQPDGGPSTDQTVVKLELPQAVEPGGSTTLDIAFFDQLPRVIARTGYFGSFHLVAQWFPKIGVLELPGERGATATRWNVHEFHAESEFYADFGSYDVTLTVPKGYTVGATGELQGAPVEKDGLLTHHYVQGDVHDFAWTADNRTARPLIDTWTGPGSPKVQLTVLFPPEYAHNAVRALKAAKDALSHFSNTLGPYPYKTVTIVIPPHNASEADGMEYPTFFTTDSCEDASPGTTCEMLLDFVTIHEFGHGYFYGILANNEFEEPMLDEGLNEYWDVRMLRDAGRKIPATTPWLKRLGIAPTWDVFAFQRAGAALENPADPLGENAYGRLQGIGPVYSRSAVALRDLEAQVGKEAMERAFKEYYRRWKFRHPSIADLREVLAESTGQRQLVERMFAQQVYAVNKVDDRIAALDSEEELPQPGYMTEQARRIERTADQAGEQEDNLRGKWEKAHPDAKEGTGPFPFRTTVILRRRGLAVPQTLVVKFADGSKETVQWNGEERWKRFEWIKPAKAVSAELDPERKHMLDTSKLDDSRTIKADSSASRRWSFDFAAIVQTILALIATV